MTIAEDRSTRGARDAASESMTWTRVCPVDHVEFDRGVAALVEGQAVAIFRLSPIVGDDGESGAEEWRAVSHLDPATGAPVIARGLVGSVGEGPIVVPTVASPLHKHRYNLRSGYCLDDDTLRLETYDVEIVDDWVMCRPILDVTSA